MAGKLFLYTHPDDADPDREGFRKQVAGELEFYSVEKHFFTPNELKRYSLGTKNKNLKYNTDGSLTIYVQSDPPSVAQSANWLPAPKNGDFSPVQKVN